MIASTCTLGEILTRVLHYEVAPALWQLTLRPLVGLHLSFRSANWLTALLGVASAYLLLRYSPFPRLFRWLLPLTFFLQYQYAVVARPYAYFPLLCFLLCILFPQQRSPVLFALVAGLLANTTLHCTVYAAALLGVYLLRTGRRGRSVEARPRENFYTVGQRNAALAIFGVAIILAVVVAFPAPDQYMMGAFRHSAVLTRHWITPETPPAGLTLDPPHTSAVQPMNSIGHRSFLTHGVLGLLTTRVAATAVFSVSRYSLLAVGFLALYAAWLWQRRQLLFLLPPVAVALSYSLLPNYPYQSGLFFVAIIASVWMSLSEGPPAVRSRISIAFATVAAMVVILQIGWSITADRDDVRGSYDAGGEVARYLQTSFPGASVAAFGYETETMSLYRPQLPLGWTHPFWTWSRMDSPNSFQSSIQQMHPGVVVVGSTLAGNRTVLGQIGLDTPGTLQGDGDLAAWWQEQGWRLTRRFCGSHFGYGGYTDLSCLSVLVQTPASVLPR